MYITRSCGIVETGMEMMLIMAFISMLYATSLLTTDTGIRIILSFVWAIIIFIIDRYIVSTFIKKESGRDWWSVQFFIRIIFAIGVGIVISHPIIIRIFDDKIQETQTEIRQSLKDKIEEDFFQLYLFLPGFDVFEQQV